MRILICGGAGYIGSHVLKALSQTNHEITVLDNLSTGHAEALTGGEFVQGDLNDEALLEKLFSAKKFEAVFHFAGSIKVPESVENPLKYYQNNTINSHRLISFCVKHNCSQFVFSSTAAVYGLPENGLALETSALSPINPYGHSKLMTEQMLKDTSAATSLRYVALRYFNVAGADPEGRVGQSFPNPFHLIDVACEAATGIRDKVEIFGTDYETPDGTCIRDYIHVSDLATAHVKALEYLSKGGKSVALNCGYGHGFSVKEVINKVIEVTGVNFKVITSARRAGDPAILAAKADSVRTVLNWTPKYDDLSIIIKTAFEWKKKRAY